MSTPFRKARVNFSEGLRRQYIWRHNSYLGHVAMAKQNMSAIQTSRSTTPQAKYLAEEIYLKLLQLEGHLKTRVGPEKDKDY